MAHPTTKRICLVTSSHLSSNPRLVKEADTLHAAGYIVHVVAGRNFPPSDSLDQTILSRAAWTCSLVDYTQGRHSLYQRGMRRAARWLAAHCSGISPKIAAQAHHQACGQLAAAARRFQADLYIGHTLAGLVAAGIAAQCHQAKLGFDGEDFHAEETELATDDQAERRIITILEHYFLPLCSHLTAASPLIAQAYAERYSIPLPATILNVFPKDLAPKCFPTTAPDDTFRMYWFSQTVGPGRGLEAIIEVASLMRPGVLLSLRGHVSAAYKDKLNTLATRLNREGLLQFLPSAPPDQMPSLASEAHLGLSIEERNPGNKDICLANKIFTYLLAGIPQLMTPTRAQSALASDLGSAALLVDLSQPAETASLLDHFRDNPDQRRIAAETAAHLARERYCWDVEKESFLKCVQSALQS